MYARNPRRYPERTLGTRKFLVNHRKMLLLKMGKAQRSLDVAASALDKARRTYSVAPTTENNRLLKEAGEYCMEASINLTKQHDKADDLNNRGLMWFDKEVEGVWQHWLSDDEKRWNEEFR